MKLHVLLCFALIIIAPQLNYSQTTRLKTVYTEDWDNWEFDDGKFKTYYTEDWDNWEYKVNGTSGKIKTYYSEDWDNWEIKGNGVTIKVKTYYTEDWDNWEVSGDISLRIKTYYSEDWDNWEIKGDNLSKYDPALQAAILFIPIFTSSIYLRGIIK